jgi:hypothetical protein
MAPDKATSRQDNNRTPPLQDCVSVAEPMSHTMPLRVPSLISPGSLFDCGQSHSSSSCGTSTSTGIVHEEEETCKTPDVGSNDEEFVPGPFLPADYEPTEHDVLCGRGFKKHKGNQRYRQTVNAKLEEYSAARCKSEKSWILVNIVAQVRREKKSTSTDAGVGRFLRKCPETDRWYDVGDFLAKEKTSQYFRDALHDQYRSSGPSKYKRRKINAMKEEGTSVRQVAGDESQSGASGSAGSTNNSNGQEHQQSRSHGNHSPLQEVRPSHSYESTVYSDPFLCACVRFCMCCVCVRLLLSKDETTCIPSFDRLELYRLCE